MSTISDLLRAAVAPQTHRIYSSYYQRFIQWGGSVHSLPHHVVDNMIAHYFVHLRSIGAGRSVASGTFYSIMHFHPALNNHLPLSARCLRGYVNLCPPVRSHPPLPFHHCRGVAFTLAAAGHLRAAIAVFLSHHCLLRINECLQIRPTHVHDASQSDVPSHIRVCMLHIPFTKTGPNQSARVSDPSIISALVYLVQRTPDNGLLFPYSARRVRSLFREACQHIGLPSSFTWHSLRHGGACEALLQGSSLETVRRLGRWRSPGSLDTYLQLDAVSFLAIDFQPSARVRRLLIILESLTPLQILLHALRGHT